MPEQRGAAEDGKPVYYCTWPVIWPEPWLTNPRVQPQPNNCWRVFATMDERDDHYVVDHPEYCMGLYPQTADYVRSEMERRARGAEE